MTLPQIEEALAAGRVEARMSSGRWWKLRRNGRTQTWKTRPGVWRIPVKAGFKSCGELTHDTWNSADFRVLP